MYFKRCGGHLDDLEGEEAEAPEAAGGGKLEPLSPASGQGALGPGGDRAGRWRGEWRGGDGPLRGPAPSPRGLGWPLPCRVFLMIRECRGLWRPRGHWSELKCATCEPGGGGVGDPGRLVGGSPAPAPPFPRLPLQVVSAPPPSRLAGLGCPRLPLRCGESGEIEAGAPAERCRPRSPGAPSDRQLNR